MMFGGVYLMKFTYIMLYVVIVRYVVTEMTINFQLSPETRYEILEGSTVYMLCQQEEQDPIFISYKDTAIVHNFSLVGSQTKYSFYQADHSNRPTFNLTVREVGKEDSGRYFCAEGESLLKQFYLDVLYPPTRGPNCTSSYGALPIFFDDAVQEEFQFNCTGEDGNPPIDFLLFKEGPERVRLEPDGVTIFKGNGHYPQRTITFSSYLNSSFNNSSFICNVFQNMPTELMSNEFNETCSYGPMTLLPSFDISVTPSNVTVREGEKTRVTCSSSVSNVEKSWSNISNDLDYDIVEEENLLHLNISKMKGVENQSITVVCEGSYGHRRISAKATLYKEQDDNAPNKASSFPLALGLGLVIIFMLIGLIY